jgi:hypothetical protein
MILLLLAWYEVTDELLLPVAKVEQATEIHVEL